MVRELVTYTLVPDREWTWHALYFHPGVFNDGKWDPAIKFLTNLLPARWQVALESWQEYTALAPSLRASRKAWELVILRKPGPVRQEYRLEVSMEHLALADVPRIPIDDSNFWNASAATARQKYDIIVPKGNTSNGGINEAQWTQWWLLLRRYRYWLPDAAGTAHLLSLGSLHPGKHVAILGCPFPNNTTSRCILCLVDGEVESLKHLFVDCRVAKSVWLEISRRQHPKIERFIVPSGNRDIITTQILFVHSLWRLSRSRRYSDLLVTTPVDAVQISKTALSIQSQRAQSKQP